MIVRMNLPEKPAGQGKSARPPMTRSNKIVLAALAALSISAPLSALAAPPKAKSHSERAHEQYASGAIASVSAQEIKLSGGETFKVAPGAPTTSYKAGDRVSVRYTTKDGARLADQVMIKKN
jgi:hypothetical protein